MKKRIILIEQIKEGNAAALIENNIFTNFQFDKEKKNHEFPLETIFICKVIRILKNLNAYFVNLPNGIVGFLKSKKKYKINDHVLVISNVFAEEGKAQPLTDKVFLKGKYSILTVGYQKIQFSKKIGLSNKKLIFDELNFFHKKNKNLGIIIRSAAKNVDVSEVLIEYHQNLKKLNSIIYSKNEIISVVFKGPSVKEFTNREWNIQSAEVFDEPNSFDKYGIWEQLEKLKSNKVELSDGSWINIEKTKAFVSVDVNSGSSFKKNSSYLINEKAIEEILKQINLRGLGGKIIIDFISLDNENKILIEKKIRKLLKNNYNFKVFGWTKMGNMELTKKNDKYNVYDFFKQY